MKLCTVVCTDIKFRSLVVLQFSEKIMEICGTKFDPEAKIWSGPNVLPLFNPNVSLGQVILYCLDSNPKGIAQINDSDGVQTTNSSLKQKTVRIAQNLLEIGYKEGDVIFVSCKNTTNLAPILFAAFLCGNPVCPLDVSFSKEMVKKLFSIITPKLLFCDSENYVIIKESIDELDITSAIYIVQGHVNGIPSVLGLIKDNEIEKNFRPPILSESSLSLAIINFSSGTTGPSKAAGLSHRQILDNFMSIPFINDVSLTFSSLYWTSGFFILITSTLFGSTRILTDQKFSPELLLALVEKYKVTVIFTPPSQLVSIVQCPDIRNRDLSSLRVYLCGGCKVPKMYANQMSKYMFNGNFSISYGMTEIGASCSMDYPESNLLSVGKLTIGLKMKICNDNGKLLGIGEDGEIFIKPRSRFQGYYDENQKRFINTDEWVASGDIGHFDDQGYLYIVDRKKDIFKYEAFTVNPSDIEETILQLPGVREACVCDVLDYGTNLPAAAVVLESESKLTTKDIKDHVTKHRTDPEQLRGGVYILDKLPITVSGKVIRGNVKKLINNLYNGNKE